MSRKTNCAVAAILSFAIAAPALARPQCYSTQDIRAMQVRQLHYELMVAALKCQPNDVVFRDKWASWVGRFGSTMNTNANQLRSLFARLGKGQAGMDRYVTQLSNDASMRAQHVEDYCGTQAKLFDTVLALSPAEMESWAANTIEKPMPATATCAAAPAAPVKQAKASAGDTKVKAQQPKAEKTKVARRDETKG